MGVMAVMAAVAAMVEVGVAAVSVGSMKSPSCISTPARQLRTCRMGVRAEMGVGGWARGPGASRLPRWSRWQPRWVRPVAFPVVVVLSTTLTEGAFRVAAAEAVECAVAAVAGAVAAVGATAVAAVAAVAVAMVEVGAVAVEVLVVVTP